MQPAATCVSFCLRERESREGREGGREGNSGRPRCPGGGRDGNLQNPPAQQKRVARRRTALPPRRTASKTLPKKFSALTLLLRSTAHPRESRSDARPRSRAGGRSPQRRRQPRAFSPRATGPPNPKRFQPETILPTRKPRFSSSFRSLRMYVRPLLPFRLPGVSNSASPNPKRF